MCSMAVAALEPIHTKRFLYVASLCEANGISRYCKDLPERQRSGRSRTGRGQPLSPARRELE